MASIVSFLRGILRAILSPLKKLWRWYRARKPRTQWITAIVAALIIIGILMFGHGAPATNEGSGIRTVTLAQVSELSGEGAGASVLGTVRSVNEAELLAESSGSVNRVNARVGQSVPAGYVIAELENASQRAAELQAEGAYDAAVAARAAVSPSDSATTARNAYRTAFGTLDTALTSYVDLFFGAQTPTGPAFILNTNYVDANAMSLERQALKNLMEEWRASLPGSDAGDPATLLTDASADAARIQAFVEKLALALGHSSGATSEQTAGLAAARTAVNGAISTLTSATSALRSGSVTSTASVDASVKSAQGALLAAKENIEKTIVRAPIAGTVNFLPIHAGDFVTNLEHVATVAQNGALQISAFVSEEQRAALSVGLNLALENGATGVITAISPALDPVTKQIDVDIAVTSPATLVNGQTVRITLPSAPAATSTAGPVLLPLSSVKLAADSRVVFTVDTDGKLAAIPVTIGDVRGDRIEITSDLPAQTRIVTDARGLSEGEAVKVAP